MQDVSAVEVTNTTTQGDSGGVDPAALDAVTPPSSVDPPPAATPPAPPAPSSAAALSISNLQVDHILRRRMLGSELQYRVRWLGLRTETWATREQLFWNGPEADAKLAEFEEWANANPEMATNGRPEDERRDENWLALAMPPEAEDATAVGQPQDEVIELLSNAAPTAARKRSNKKKSSFAGKRKSRSSSISAARQPRSRSRGGGVRVRGRGRSLSRVSGALSDSDAGTDDDAVDSVVDDPRAAASLAADGIYEVERLLGDVWEGGVHWYRVKWRGYSDFDNSWQRPEDLTGCADQLRAYWARKKAKRAKFEERARDARRRELLARAEAEVQRAIKKPAQTIAPLQNELAVAAAAKAANAAGQVPLAPVQATIVPDESSAAGAATTAPAPLSSSQAGVTTLVPLFPTAQASPTRVTCDDDEFGGFQVLSYSTLAAAQNDTEPASHAHDTTHTRELAAASPTAAAAAATTTTAPGAFAADYEDHPPSDSDSISDGGSDGSCSSSSTTSLLLHPAHKHTRDTPQCILAHDYYSAPNDQPTWLLLVKWRHRPVADASWEPRDAILLNNTQESRRIITTYLKQVTDAHTRACIQKNTKP